MLRNQQGIVLLLSALFGLQPGPAHATTPPPSGALAVLPQGDALELREGDKPLARFVPKTPAAERGPLAARRVEVQGHDVIEARVQVKTGDAPRTEAWVAELGRGAPRIIFWDVVGALDVDGETAAELVVEPTAITQAQTVRRLSRCDGAPVPLLRRTYDFASRTFKATPPALPPALPPPLEARRGTSGMPTGAPLGGFYFTAASSSAGMDQDVRRLRPPTALNDGSPETLWQADRQSDGKGELLTARSSGGFPITGLRFLPGDTRSAPAFQRSRKPRQLTLVFSPTDRVDVTLVEDGDGGKKRYLDPFWIALPKPVASGCVTVLVRETTPGREPLAIAGIEVMTELDGPGAVDRLVADLAAGRSCAARSSLLNTLGATALPKLLEKLPQVPPSPGRECLVEALPGLLPKDAALPSGIGDALAATLPGATPREERILLDLLSRAPEAPNARLLTQVGNEAAPDTDRLRAVRALLIAPSPTDLERLLALLGAGRPSFRVGLRDQLLRAKAPLLPVVLASLQALGATRSPKYADLLLVLGGQAREVPEARAGARAILTQALGAGQPFEVQARAIEALAQLGDDDALKALTEARPRVGDAILRQFLAAALANSTRPAALPGLREALWDEDPKVRELAAEGLGRLKDTASAAQLIKGAEQEPWPMVRRAEIAALGELCVPEGNTLLLRAFQRDELEVRRAGMVGLVKCQDHRAPTLLIRTLGRAPEAPELRALAARLLGEHRDRRTVPYIAEALGRLLTESQADLGLEGVVGDVANALAGIGGPAASQAITPLLDDPRPAIARMGVDALARLCAVPAAREALERASKKPDESVAVPAAAALGRCRATK